MLYDNKKNFNINIKNLIKEISTGLNGSCKQKREFFKYRVRNIAIKRSKSIKNSRNRTVTKFKQKLYKLSVKEKITEEEELERKDISLQLGEYYMDIAKGAFIRSRAKWLEEGEKSSKYFFSIEKRVKMGYVKPYLSLRLKR